VKIDQQTGRISGEFQIGDHLRLVDRADGFDRLQLEDQALLDQDVDLETRRLPSPSFPSSLLFSCSPPPVLLRFSFPPVFLDR
jgi:hypothetical protein